MARPPRFSVPGQPQHVIQRGNNRQAIFDAEEDYRRFLEIMEAAAEANCCHIHAYVLMTNHVHILVTPSHEEGVGRMMQSLGRRYVQYFNYRYRRTGGLWEGRYRATLIDTEQYLFTCMRYIELNPVRARMVSLPGDYRWSSHGANAGGRHDSMLTPHTEYLALGSSLEVRQAAYRELFRRAVDDDSFTPIREATNKGWVCGDEKFKQSVAARLERRTEPLPRGGDHCSEAFRKR